MAVGTAAMPCKSRLRERIQSERQVVRGLLKKAEGLVTSSRKDVDGGAAVAPRSEPSSLPRRGKKNVPFLRPEATATDGAASPKKRRKTTAGSPIVEVEVIEPTMPKAQRDRLYGLLSSLSAETPLPPHIVGLMQSQCCCVVVPNGDEMDIDLGKTKDAALFQLLNLLQEFAQQQSKIQPRLAEEQEPPKIDLLLDASDAISRSSICQLEDGEIADEGADMGIDICGGVSPLVVDKAQFSPLPKQQEEDELINTSGGGGISLQSPPAKQQEDEFMRDASPVAVDKFPQSESPSLSSSSSSSSSSGSSSGSSSSSSSSSSGSSGSSCSGSSSSSSGSDSDSDDDDDDSASSRPDISDLPTEAAAKPLEQQQVTVHDKKLISPQVVDKVQQEEDDELIDICGGVSPVSVNKFPETPRSSSSDSSSSSRSDSSSSGSSSSGSSSSSSDSDSDDDGDSASSRPDTADQPTEAEVKPLEPQDVAEQDKKLIAERAASPDAEMKELIGRAQEKQKLRVELERKTARELERKRAREQLREMRMTARPVYDSIDPRDMKQLGISDEAQYIVSPVKSRDSLRRRGGGLLQKLGLFLKE